VIDSSAKKRSFAVVRKSQSLGFRSHWKTARFALKAFKLMLSYPRVLKGLSWLEIVRDLTFSPILQVHCFSVSRIDSRQSAT
jgi:hypothetical protein